MGSVKSLIKWPGGKSKEIKYIEKLIPSFDRYVEPFFGGGAMFFYLQPEKAVINDISRDLISFYKLVKSQSSEFYQYLISYEALLKNILQICDENYTYIHDTYTLLCTENNEAVVSKKIREFVYGHFCNINCCNVKEIILDTNRFNDQIIFSVMDKMTRTVKNQLNAPFDEDDLKENLITGFISGVYMYFRGVYNDIRLKKTAYTSEEYNTANFYFIREYCYGSMFRFNSSGEFNIPYGGMSYNRKDFHSKINNIFSDESKRVFLNTDIFCMDFEKFFEEINLSENDFIFLDPPYDSDFSDYDGKIFDWNDQYRLSMALRKTKAKFILIIKNTDYIFSLYDGYFKILQFDKTYTYNVRSRNDRNTQHLIITNIQA